ncbi:hypothetical protein ACVWXO_005389 [Bradyrhizobium sp. LM2.7]
MAGQSNVLLSGKAESIASFVTDVNNLSLFTGTTQLVTDALDGSAGKDNIQGIASNAAIHNIIQGGAGADVMSGGLGSDYFVFARATDSPAAGQVNPGGQLAQTWDQITNFQVGSDKLDFSQLVSDQSVSAAGGVTASAAGLAEFRWFGAQAANTTSMGSANGYSVWYTPDASGGVYVYADTNGDGSADLKFQLAGVTGLNPSDFLGVDPPSAFAVKLNPIEPSQSNPWLINLADGNAGVTVTGTVTHFTLSAQLIVTLNGHNYAASVAANGTWSAFIPAADLAHSMLADGSYTLTATVKVGASSAASDSHSVVVDETPPAETISSTIGTNTGLTTTISSGGLTKDSTLALSGTVSDLNGVASVHVFDGSTDLGAASVTGNSWTFTTTALSDGPHSLTAKAIDTAGNSTTTVAVTATVDTTADAGPALALSAVNPTGGAKAGAVSISLSGIDSDIASGTITLSDGTHTATHTLTAAEIAAGSVTLGSGAFTNFANLNHVDNTITVSASLTDDAGNTASPSSTGFVLDTTADAGPVLSLSAVNPTGGAKAGAVSISLSGIDSDM